MKRFDKAERKRLKTLRIEAHKYKKWKVLFNRGNKQEEEQSYDFVDCVLEQENV